MEKQITVTLTENRKFEPASTFVEKARVKKKDLEALGRAAKENPEGYWEKCAKSLLRFKKPWNKVCEWNPPHAKWFLGATLNASDNCLDRHLVDKAQKAALIWEGEPNDSKSPGPVTWTYQALHDQVERFTAVLRSLGLKPGDRVAIYMPLILESVVAMLACARGGFTHTVVFGGFSAEALKDRINDAAAKLIITADGGYRKGAWLDLRAQVRAAAEHTPTVTKIVCVERATSGRLWSRGDGDSEFMKTPEKEVDYGRAMQAISQEEKGRLGAPEWVDSEHPLFILYTSGTTGKPKGIVHSTAGYMTGVTQTTQMVFDLKDNDVYWCTADIGWITGHSYVVYGPLALGATLFLYEGAPTTPTADRMWRMIESHKVTILYTAPTAIRALMRLGPENPKGCDLSSLRLLGTVGEPINPEAWIWYHQNIGNERCPIVDTFWQTETGAIVIAPVPGVTATKPGSATFALPGYDVDVVDKAGVSVPPGGGGYLVIKRPWPSMARTIHGDAERFQKQYFSDFAGGIYFTGDGARRDSDGYFWVLGRVDDVLNVSGHRLGTMEIESALVSHTSVAEAAVVGRPDDLKGQAVVAFVTLKAEISKRANQDKSMLKKISDDLKQHVTKEIGALARPDDLRFTDSLPKTRSGKIMRRLLRELASSGQVKGDTTTLEDWGIIQNLQAAASGDEE